MFILIRICIYDRLYKVWNGGIAMDEKEIKMNSRETFDRQANSYDHDIKGRHARRMYQVVLNTLNNISYSNFLDLGCGKGELIKIILENDNTKKGFGIDLSSKMIEVAKKKLPESVSLMIGDSENLPYPNQYFDVIYCNDSFHHYPSPENVIKEVFRVLKQGGTFIICDCWQPYLGRVIMNTYMKYSKEGDVRIYSQKELENLLHIEFETVIWKKLSNTSCLCIAKKSRRRNE